MSHRKQAAELESEASGMSPAGVQGSPLPGPWGERALSPDAPRTVGEWTEGVSRCLLGSVISRGLAGTKLWGAPFATCFPPPHPTLLWALATSHTWRLAGKERDTAELPPRAPEPIG